MEEEYEKYPGRGLLYEPLGRRVSCQMLEDLLGPLRRPDDLTEETGSDNLTRRSTMDWNKEFAQCLRQLEAGDEGTKEQRIAVVKLVRALFCWRLAYLVEGLRKEGITGVAVQESPTETAFVCGDARVELQQQEGTRLLIHVSGFFGEEVQSDYLPLREVAGGKTFTEIYQIVQWMSRVTEDLVRKRTLIGKGEEK